MSGHAASVATGRHKPVSLDTILEEELGQFGWYQLRTLALIAIVEIFSGWQAEYVFTAARIHSRCLIPECEGPAAAEFSPSWILNAVPAAGDSFQSCQRFTNTTSTDVTESPSNGTCPVSLFDQQTVTSCEQNVYAHTDTVVYDYDLGCDEWRRSLIGSVRTVGTLVSLPITGLLSDRWGRRAALAFNAFNTGWIGVTRYWARTYIGFVISQFAEAALGAGIVSCVYILMMELVGPKYRVPVSATMSTCFALGQVSLGALAWAVPNWQQLTLVLYIPQMFTIVYFWIMAESVRWYMSKGRYDIAEKVLKDVARVNRKYLSEKSLEALKQTAEEEKLAQALQKEHSSSEPWLPVLVWRHKPVLVRCIVSPVWWITMTFVYYGLSINAVNMSGNPYINYMAVSAVEIPGFWMSTLFLNWFGRKPVLTATYWICAACQIAYIFLPNALYAASLSVYLVGKLSISMVVTALYVYTAELYPTKYRHRLFAFSSMVGRIGSILAPLTPAFGENLPFILFGSFAALSGLLVFITPETRGCSFPDTMQEAADIGRATHTPSDAAAAPQQRHASH